MTKTLFLSLTVLTMAIHSSDFAYAQRVNWEKVGSTRTDCAFQATFYQLKGFPFGKLEVSLQGKTEIIPLALQQEASCQKYHYDTAYPRSLSIPTYMVDLTDLCQGSLPKVSADIFLSGVTSSCRME